MRYTQKTADDLKNEINALSVAKNQHQAGLEAMQAEEKNVEKILEERKKVILNVGLEVEDSQKRRKAEKKRLEAILSDTDDASADLASVERILSDKNQEKVKLESDIVGLKNKHEETKNNLEIQVQTLKDSIAKNCEKIKNLL